MVLGRKPGCSAVIVNHVILICTLSWRRHRIHSIISDAQTPPIQDDPIGSSGASHTLSHFRERRIQATKPQRRCKDTRNANELRVETHSARATCAEVTLSSTKDEHENSGDPDCSNPTEICHFKTFDIKDLITDLQTLTYNASRMEGGLSATALRG